MKSIPEIDALTIHKIDDPTTHEIDHWNTILATHEINRRNST